MHQGPGAWVKIGGETLVADVDATGLAELAYCGEPATAGPQKRQFGHLGSRRCDRHPALKRCRVGQVPGPTGRNVVDLLWAAIGAVVGGLIVAILFEVTARRASKPQEHTKLTTGWRLREFGTPVLVARDLWGITVPPGSHVFASGMVDPEVVRTCKVETVPPVRAEFALDPEKGRAILFPGGLRDGNLAVVTVDPVLVGRLETEYKMLKGRATGYAERHTIREIAGRKGVVVETRGTVQDVLPWKDGFLIRLEDQGSVIGVLVAKDPVELKGQRIVVKGPVDQDKTGYPTIDAQEIHLIR